MSIISSKELFRKGIYEVGKSRLLYREWVCVLSDDAISSPIVETAVADAVPIEIGAFHPTYGDYRCRKITITEGHEGSPYHLHVAAEYGVVLENELLAPTSRAAVWEFDASPGEVPALYYYHGSGNATMRPLTNSANDYFPGLVTTETLISIKVSKNFAVLPSAWINAQNCVNDSIYLGCPEHSIVVNRVTITQSDEDAGGVVKYWQATAELQYRQSGHNLQLPDIGFNFLASGQKRRCMVFDFQNTEWIPSPNPVGLDGNGNQTGGIPAILNRRVKPEANFDSLFGSPPTTPLA